MLLDKPPQVFKVELRGIQEGEDIVDWIKQRISCWDTYSPISEENGKEILVELLAEIKFKIPLERDQTAKSHDWPKQISLQMRTLPLWSDNLLPSPLREFVSELSKSLFKIF